MIGAQRYDYSLYRPDIVIDEERARRIAYRMVDILKGRLGELSGLSCLDIGCSAGRVTNYYGRYFKRVLAIDVDGDAIEFARRNSTAKNVEYRQGDIMRLELETESFDVVIVIGIYEYTPDAERLFEIIFRALKRNGACYLQARNRFSIVEQETGLFMINFLPRRMARLYARAFKKDKLYYDRTLFLPALRRLVRKFRVYDYTLEVMRRPQRYLLPLSFVDDSTFARLLTCVAKIFYFAFPNYIWVLSKE